MSMRQGFIKAYDVELEKKFGSQIRMAEFAGVHSARRIISDQKYVLERAADRKEQGERPEADQLELIFIEGVNVGGWLGDVTGDRDAYQARAQATAQYDDFSHRLDAAVELLFAKPIRSHDDEGALRQTTIGIDVTVSGSPIMILDKLTRHYSDRSCLPFGFSRLDYYAHDDVREAKAMVLRYVIGLNVREVRRIWRRLKPGSKGGHLQAFRPNSPESLQMRFKVLSEIRAQNLLYCAMLPEDQTDKVVRKAALQIDAVDECLNAALKDCTKQIIARRVVPEKVFAPRRDGRKLPSEREAIEEFFIAESWQKYRNDDPFQQIMSKARRLLGILYDTDEDNPVRRALTERRKIMMHNQRLAAPIAQL